MSIGQILKAEAVSHLFKYTTVETAKRVIASRAFRWSSPLKFNDPFDHQTGLQWPFSGEELALALADACRRVVFGTNPFEPMRPTTFGLLLSQARLISGRLPQAEFESSLLVACQDVARSFPNHCRDLNEFLIQELTRSRVLCLTDRPDNVVMWSHYSDEHRGVVFKLNRLDHIDHRMLAARRVDYSDEPLVYAQLGEYVGHLLGECDLPVVERVREIAYRKHPDWAYESEWRLHMPLLDCPDGDGFSCFDEPQELFDSIVLGCRIDEEVARDVVLLAREHLPAAQIFRAVRCRDRIRLDFEKCG